MAPHFLSWPGVTRPSHRHVRCMGGNGRKASGCGMAGSRPAMTTGGVPSRQVWCDGETSCHRGWLELPRGEATVGMSSLKQR